MPDGVRAPANQAVTVGLGRAVRRTVEPTMLSSPACIGNRDDAPVDGHAGRNCPDFRRWPAGAVLSAGKSRVRNTSATEAWGGSQVQAFRDMERIV